MNEIFSVGVRLREPVCPPTITSRSANWSCTWRRSSGDRDAERTRALVRGAASTGVRCPISAATGSTAAWSALASEEEAARYREQRRVRRRISHQRQARPRARAGAEGVDVEMPTGPPPVGPSTSAAKSAWTFRDLVRDLAASSAARIEMRQIGARDTRRAFSTWASARAGASSSAARRNPAQVRADLREDGQGARTCRLSDNRLLGNCGPAQVLPALREVLDSLPGAAQLPAPG